jgi:NTP pyrophosphatase (non-canonical NTP hydrolase)
MTFIQLQTEVAEWANRNFEANKSWHPLLGMMEELGELSHAYLKAEQGIRGTAAEHSAAKRDALGDIVIYMADYCSREGFSLQQIVEETWEIVRQRDWKKNPQKGMVVQQGQ